MTRGGQLFRERVRARIACSQLDVESGTLAGILIASAWEGQTMTNPFRLALRDFLGVALLLCGGCGGCNDHNNPLPASGVVPSGPATLATLGEQAMGDAIFNDAPLEEDGGSFVFCCDEEGPVRVHVGKITITPMPPPVEGELVSESLLIDMDRPLLIDMDSLGLTLDDVDGPFEFDVGGQPFGPGSPAEPVGDGITVDVYATSCNFESGTFDLLLAAVADVEDLDLDDPLRLLPPIFFQVLRYEVRNECPETGLLVQRGEPQGCVATFGDGSYTVTGAFGGATTWGVGQANETTMTPGGTTDLFVAHYLPDGSLAWLETAGGSTGDDAFVDACIAGTPDGGCVVAGAFGTFNPNATGTVTFGAGDANETTMTSSGKGDVFVAKYDSDGVLQWARQDGGNHALVSERAGGVCAFDDGSCVVTGGYFEGGATFGGGEPNETILPSDGGFDFFIARYTPDGELAWARRAGGPGLGHMGADVTCNTDGSCTVVGALQGTATYGADEANETDIESYDPAKIDAFIARYEQNGDLGWAQRMGGPGAITGDDVIAGGITGCGDGASYVAGAFRGSLILGEGMSEQTLTSTVGGDLDMFIARYAADGSLLWANSEGDLDSEQVIDLDCVQADDSCIVVGTSTPQFVPGQDFTPDTLFLHRYAADGSGIWMREQGGTGVVTATSVGAFPDGSSLVTGQFTGSTTFGNPPDAVTLTALTPPDSFHVKYDPDGNVAARP